MYSCEKPNVCCTSQHVSGDSIVTHRCKHATVSMLGDDVWSIDANFKGGNSVITFSREKVNVWIFLSQDFKGFNTFKLCEDGVPTEYFECVEYSIMCAKLMALIKPQNPKCKIEQMAADEAKRVLEVLMSIAHHNMALNPHVFADGTTTLQCVTKEMDGDE